LGDKKLHNEPMKTLYPCVSILLRSAALMAWIGLPLPALAQSAALTGVLGSKALLVVDGSAPKALAAGEEHRGVKLLSVAGEQAVVEIKGQRSTLRVGDAPVSVGNSSLGANGSKIVLPMGSGGHFMTQGTVNGRSIQFMVDTGATTVALGVSDAQRLGINYEKGQPVRMNTANGVAQGWRVKLNSVRIGDVEVFDVEAIVGPNMPFALLGNSFLSRFSMKRESDMMVLERRF
jgi:aspartyl protease family protein